MEAPLISLISASDRISISHTELLCKCQEESLPVYYSPPSSLNIWALKTLSDDPVYSLWARVSDIPSQTLYSRSPLRKRYIDVDLPPTVLHTSCYFKLKDAEITGLLQKGSIKTSGFTQLYQLDGRNMKPGGTALPSDRELALFEKVRSETKRAKKLTPLSIGCLLYTSDAADDTPCVDLGGSQSVELLFVTNGQWGEFLGPFRF